MDLTEDTVTGASEAEMEQIVAWVKQGRASQRKTINTRITSYGLKHMIEQQMGTYISNESVIVAFKRMGFTAKPITHTPNFYFNIALNRD